MVVTVTVNVRVLIFNFLAVSMANGHFREFEINGLNSCHVISNKVLRMVNYWGYTHELRILDPSKIVQIFEFDFRL